MPIISFFDTNKGEELADKQDKLIGTQGQMVGFDEDGNAVPQEIPDVGVTSFHGRDGDVVPQVGDYTAEQVGAIPASERENFALKTDVPSKISQLENDAGFLTAHQDISGKLDKTATAAAATKLSTARTIRANLASTSTASFDGTANATPGVTEVLPVANGGTGSSTEKYLPLAGGTVTGVTTFSGNTVGTTPNATDGVVIKGNLRLKGSGNYGNTLRLGDGDYVHLSEPTDDCLEIKAKKVNFVLSDTTTSKLTVNGSPLSGGGGLTKVETKTVSSGGSVSVTLEESGIYFIAAQEGFNTPSFSTDYLKCGSVFLPMADIGNATQAILGENIYCEKVGSTKVNLKYKGGCDKTDFYIYKLN